MELKLINEIEGIRAGVTKLQHMLAEVKYYFIFEKYLNPIIAHKILRK